MNIAEAKSRYLDAGKCFDPDYERDNEALASFREANPTLSEEQTRYLTEILTAPGDDWRPKFFVADLLYYYQSAHESLLAPMLRAAIEFEDPSFNRVFLRPCL